MCDLALEEENCKYTRELLQNGRSYVLILSDHAVDTHLSQLKKVYFDGIFLEEGYRASNSESGIFNKFGNVLQANATIIITGTVVQSRLSQFLNVLKLIDQII